MNQPGEISSPSAPTTRSTNSLRGILIPFATPFTSNEDLDKEGLRRNITRWNQTGVVGYVALGSTGERVNLHERECAQVIEIARQEIPKEMQFVVGAGQQSTRSTIAEIKQIAAAGADAVLVITPYFYRSAITQDALAIYFNAVADASPLPVILYSMPDLTGIKIKPETVGQLSAHPNIIGIKDSSADIVEFEQTVNLVPKDFAVLAGNATVLSSALQIGARGAILAVGCVAARQCVEVYRLVEAGETVKAEALQEKLTPLALAVTKRYGIAGLKAAMEMVGFNGGAIRAPLQPANSSARAEIAKLLEELGIRSLSESEAKGSQGELAGVMRT